MSLMSRIGRRLLAAPKPKSAEFKASLVHPGKADLHDPRPSPPPRAKSAETRQRMSESQKRRYAKSDPVPTSAQPAADDAHDLARERFEREVELSTSAGMARQLTRMITPPKAAPPPAEPRAPRITPPPLPPVPPRPELDLAKGLEALPLPAPPPAPPPAPASTTSRGSCKARNPATGIQCALLAGHTKLHRHGSTEFRFGAAPGASAFPRRDALEEAAHGRPDSPFTTT